MGSLISVAKPPPVERNESQGIRGVWQQTLSAVVSLASPVLDGPEGVAECVARATEELAYARTCQPDLVHEYLVALALAIERRYLQSWELADVDERIRLYREALALSLRPPQGSYTPVVPGAWPSPPEVDVTEPAQDRAQDRPLWQSINTSRTLWRTELLLCLALEDRSQHVDDATDLQEWTTLAKSLVYALPDTHALLSPALRTLGRSLYIHFERVQQDPQMIEDAVASFRQAASLCHMQGHACDECLDHLGTCLYQLFSFRRERSLHSESIALVKFALDLRPPSHPKRHQTMYHLAVASSIDHDEQSVHDMREVIQLCEKALAGYSAGHPDRPAVLYALGRFFRLLYDRCGDLQDLHSAIVTTDKALSLCPTSHPARGRLLYAAAVYALSRFGRTGDTNELDQVTRLLDECLKLCGPRHPLHGLVCSTLGWVSQHRFELLGKPKDMEESVLHYRKSLQLHPPGHPHRDHALNNLAGPLMLSFKYLGLDNNLYESIDLLREACTIMPRNHPQLALTLVNLGSTLMLRFEVLGHVDALDEAIHTFAEAYERKGDKYQGEHEILHHFGKALRFRYELNGSLDDLEGSISKSSAALVLRPLGDRRRAETLQQLAAALACRFALTGANSDLSEALEYQREAISSLTSQHPDLCGAICGLARLHFLVADSPSDFDKAMVLLHEELQNALHHPQTRLSEALTSLQAVENLPYVGEASERILQAYRLSIGLLPRVAFFGLDLRSRLAVLARANYVAPMAATRALLLKQPEVAVEILEEGRAVFWAQHLRLRANFEGLPDNMSTRLAEVAQQLKHRALHDQGSGRDDITNKVKTETEASRMRLLSEEFEEIVNKARKLPGLQRFMMHDTYEMLSSAAERYPVVLLLAGSVGCHAILLRPGCTSPTTVTLKVRVEELKALNEQLVGANAHQRKVVKIGAPNSAPLVENTNVLQVLKSLWLKVMAPIVATLGWMKQSGRARPRLWICPTGAFTHLPVHAAGLYTSGDNENCAEYFVPSYTPTLAALRNARQGMTAPRKAVAMVLLAAVSKPFQYEMLSYVEQEAERVVRAVPSQSLIHASGTRGEPAVLPTSATANQVLQAVPQAAILHMACHGLQNASEPLKSGFVMSDEMLTLAQLMSLELPNAFFAFLSACETAKGDAQNPDEAIHLAATMLYAGFKSVVGTLWSMNDYDGPFVAKTVYDALYAGNMEFLDPEVIPYALDEAISEIRRQAIHPSRWALYVHLGV